MAFEELLVIVLLLWLHSGAGSAGGKLGDDEYRNYGDSISNNRNAVANITTCKPCNVVTTLTRVASGQSIVDKAQKHNIFVKVSSRCVWIVALDQTPIKASTLLAHQV